MTASGDTIAAIATAPGPAGVAVVRVSGPAAWGVARALTGREPVAGAIAFARLRSRGGELLDEAVTLAFRAPRSYTGEDVVEFQCHGGAVTPRRVLEACFAAGARLARRGEFTERAFLNGKLDYGQAEAVIDLIQAKTVRSADAALAGLAGSRRRRTREFYETALALSAELEHALDVDEGELPSGFARATRLRAEALRSALAEAVRGAREGKILREGALVVLAGSPNAGKSSLMNALLAENRAIVSDIPGTTRDSIEEWLDLDGWPVRLVDTAGLRETADAIEAEGVRRSEALIVSAEVVVRLVSADAAADGWRADAREVRVLAKADLASAEVRARAARAGALAVSVRTGEGLAALRRELARRLEARTEAEAASDDGDEGEVAALIAAARSLAELPDDLVLVANALHRACEILGEGLGAVYSDDLLERLFSRFCVGK